MAHALNFGWRIASSHAPMLRLPARTSAVLSAFSRTFPVRIFKKSRFSITTPRWHQFSLRDNKNVQLHTCAKLRTINAVVQKGSTAKIE